MIIYHNDSTSQHAFTLVELLVVVAIIGVLASIAIPSYQDSVTKSRRTDAKGVLMEFANAMERHFTENNTYCDAGGAGGANTCAGSAATNDSGSPSIFSTTSPLDGSVVYYNLTLVATASTYTLSAAPTGTHANDKCGTLTLTHTGVKGFTGAGLTSASCW